MAVLDEMERQIHIGPRVRALREAMDLSLRDLAERSGVSAPMLSQVERGETSPTLQVASRIAAGLELRLSQLLRLDESGTGTIVRARARRHGAGWRGAPRPPRGARGCRRGGAAARAGARAGGRPGGGPPPRPPPRPPPGRARGSHPPPAPPRPPPGGGGRPADARAGQP